MKPRLAIRDGLLLGGIGFGLLALLLLVTPGWLRPAGAPDLGPPEPTAPAPTPTMAYAPTPPAPPAPEKPPADAATPLPDLPTRLPGPLLTTIPPMLAPPLSPPYHGMETFCTPTATPPTPDPQATPWPTAVGDESGRRDFGAWGYTYSYGRDWGDLFAAVYYDDSSVAGLEAYVQANRALADQLAQLRGDESFSPSRGLARVDLTFRGYVAPEQARAWVQAHTLLVEYAVLRVYDPQGLRLDFTVLTGDVNDPIPAWYIDRELNPPNVPSCGPFTMQGGGVFFVTALADPAALPALAADPLVYLADVTPNAVRRDLWQQYQETRTNSFKWVRVQNGSPFWAMEDLGLEHFR